MKQLIQGAIAASALAIAAPVLAQDIIVVVHGQANDPFWSVVKNGVDKAAEDTSANVDFRSPETFDTVFGRSVLDL
jgi:simple sugar transport system substrate-binding protein